MTLDSLNFDVEGFSLEIDDGHQRLWRSPQNCVVRLQCFSHAPQWTFDLTNAEACAEFAARAVVGELMTIGVTTAGGCEVLQWLEKLWPAGSTGRFYIAMIWIPFSDAHFKIDIGAGEHGTTGIRESTVTMLHHQQPSMPASPDDEFWDGVFTEHPLTLVRRRLRQILATLTIVSQTEPAPFRVG